MADDSLIREPDEDTGPALMNREPILFPEQRKKAVQEGRRRVQELRRRLNE